MRAAARRSARCRCGRPCASARTRSRAAAARGRASSRRRPRRWRAGDSRRPRRPTARGRRGAGGPPRRRWSRAAARRRAGLPAAPRRAAQVASGSCPEAPAGRTALSTTPLPSSSQAASVRVESMRSQSGSPHDVAALAEAADLVPADAPVHAADLLVAGHAAGAGERLGRLDAGRRTGGLEGQLVVADAQRPAPERLLDGGGEAVELEPLEVRLAVDGQAAAGQRGHRLAAVEDDGERAAAARADSPSRASPCRPAAGSPKLKVTASENPGPGRAPGAFRSPRRSARAPGRGQAVVLDVDRGAVDHVVGSRRAARSSRPPSAA